MNKKINLGIMGFGHVGRYIYTNTLNSDIFNVKAISDIGRIESLNYLLNNDPRNKNLGVEIDSNSLVFNGNKTRFVHGV